MMINAVCRAFGKEDQLPRNHQMMLFWAGLRGAVAFALASGITGDSAPAMRTTILAVVVLTVLLFGGTTSRMLQVLDVRTGVIEPDESGSEGEEAESGKVKYIKVNNDLIDGNEQSTSRYADQSIGGLLSGPLGEPIPEDRPPHWFVSFDEKWLKPFLTKKHVQQRNLTLAEYWREKRRKMERANRNMLDGIRVDDDENSDSLTLSSVKTNNRSYQNNTGSFPRPGLTPSKIVIGSGRVFGRSPSIDSEDEYNDHLH